MNRSNPQPRSLSADHLGTALHEVGGTTRPRYLDDILAQAEHTRQRPAWTFTERWLPMSIALRREGVPRAAVLFTLFLLLLGVVALAITFAGAPRVPAPLVVTNGLIAFASGDDIVAVRPDGTGRQTLVDGTGTLGPMEFSPDGKRLAYWTDDGRGWDLIAIDADGSDPVTVATDAINPSEPSWSPDGAQIVYMDAVIPSGDEASSHLFVAATDGSGGRQIGDPTLEVRPPAWSPAGSTIAFGASDRAEPGIWRLHLMDPDGSNIRQVSDVRGDAWAFVTVEWSHDGSKIVAQAGDADNVSEWDIWTIEVATGKATDVGAHEGGDEQLPAWAPDRDALAWGYDKVVLLEPGGEPVDLTSEGRPRWSPNGRYLLAESGGRTAIVDLTGVVQLSLDGVTEFLSWQPVIAED